MHPTTPVPGRPLRRASLLACALVLLAASGARAITRLHLHQEPRTGRCLLRLRVFVLSSVPLGAYTLETTFDSRAVELLGIEGGTGPEFSAQPLLNATEAAAGHARFAAVQAVRLDGPKGHVHIATLVLRRRAPTPETGLDVRVLTMVDTAGTKYRVAARHKTLRRQGPKSPCAVGR